MEVSGVEQCPCSGSDGIPDTNNAEGPASGCVKNTRSCGSQDMTQNFMDYSSCSEFFTQGQVNVMRGFLEPDGLRSGIATSNRCVELKSNDIALIDIEFPAKNEVVCTQTFKPVIQFANNGSDTLKQASFKILINDDTEFTADWSGELLFADYASIPLTEITGNIGSQKITIEVESVNGVDDEKSNNDVQEQSFQVKILDAERLPFREDFERDLNNWTINNLDGDEDFKVNAEISHFGDQCISLNNFSISESGRVDELISQNLDIASYTEPELKFYYAFANKRTEPGFDELQVLFTNDCGVNFDTLFIAVGNELASATNTDEAFIPVNSQWKRVTIDLAPYKEESFASIHFKFISGLGNNFYLDDISVTGSEPTFTNIFNDTANYQVELSPNPFQQKLQINLPNELLNKDINTKIYTSLGKQIKTVFLENSQSLTTIQVEDIPTGVYFIHLQIDQSIHLIQKMIKL